MKNKPINPLILTLLVIVTIASNTFVCADDYKTPTSFLNLNAFSSNYITPLSSKSTLSSKKTLSSNELIESENFYISPLQIRTADYKNFKFSFNMGNPSELTELWKNTLTQSSSEDYSLKTIELNPSTSYQVNDQFSIGGGLRMIYAKGKVKSNPGELTNLASMRSSQVPGISAANNETPAAHDMGGDTISYGYNLAITYQPTHELAVGLSYRSNVDLDVESNSKLYTNSQTIHSNGASVSVHMPASLNLAFAYNIMEKTTVEFILERTLWSRYESLDFNNSTSIHPMLVSSFDDPNTTSWNDANTYRLGLSHHYSKQLKFMFGYARDEAPVPNDTLAYELTGSDGNLYSAGFEYKFNDAQSIGMSYLYLTRAPVNVSNSTVGDTFTNTKAFLATIAYKHAF
ncbi:MAG: outer membrane protein transport protein [Gammaproteobacteria bacterium]|nr:outer membrane protein transport protein [Gammaproteobacteria bacterium]